MVFEEPLTWTCHICGEERPDAKISVLTKPLVINGKTCGEQNVRYCNDRAECIEGALHKDFFGGGSDLCWLCEVGHVKETIEQNFEVSNIPGCGTVILPKARVGRCDYCQAVLYALRTE